LNDKVNRIPLHIHYSVNFGCFTIVYIFFSRNRFVRQSQFNIYGSGYFPPRILICTDGWQNILHILYHWENKLQKCGLLHNFFGKCPQCKRWFIIVCQNAKCRKTQCKFLNSSLKMFILIVFCTAFCRLTPFILLWGLA
jgi:hypothetical protein